MSPCRGPSWVSVFVVLLFFCMSLTGGATGARADADAALEQARADLAEARAALARERDAISAERAQHAMQYESMQAEVRALRERRQEVQRVSSRRETERTSLRRRSEATQAEVRAAAGLVTEFRRASESAMSAAARQRHAEQLLRIDEALAADEASGLELGAVGPAIELALNLLLRDPVSHSFDGFALDGDGRVIEGRFLAAGPCTYFMGVDTVGYVDTARGASEPVLADALGRREHAALAAWAAGEASLAPVDVTGGALLRVVRARVPLIERIKQGGAVMVPLLLIAAVCILILLRRHLALRGMEVNVEPTLAAILEELRQGNEAAARDHAEGLASPWQDVLVEAVNHWRADRVYLEEVLQDRIVMQGPEVTKELGALAICAAAAPLLGLLGTVTGMIHTFQLITVFGTGDARSLSGGISEALITTQFGLMIAVPVLLAHAYMARRAKGVMTGLEQAAIRFVRNVPTKGLAP